MTLQKIKEIGNFSCNVSHLNIMARKIKENPKQVYTIMALYGSPMDSYTRESIFSYIADKYYKGNYGIIYNAWLK